MKQRILILAIGTLMVFAHCDDCVCDQGPFIGELRVKLTINEENPNVLVTIFEGKIERGDTLFTELINDTRVVYDLEAGRYYSATAEYADGIRTIIAVDGKRMEVTEENDDCGCEGAENITLNLRLAN